MRKILHGFIGLIALTGAMLLSMSTCFAAEELRIAGQLVTKGSAGDLADLSGAINVGSGGTFTYDFDKKTLTMKRVTITMTSSSPAISSSIKGLKIVVLASNTLQTESSEAMKLEADTEIKTEASSEGTLNIKSTSGVGIYAKNTVEINDITLNVEGSQGIAGKTDATRVVFKNLTGKITGSEAAINEIKNLSLNRTYFSSPANATFDAKEKHGVVNEEKKFVRELTLAPSLGFSIAGTEITRDNYDKMDKIPGVKVLDGGYLTFDPNQDFWHQSLKIKNVEINGGQHPALSGSFGTLEVAGNNKLSSDGTVLYLNDLFLLKGIDKEATLELTSKNDAAIYAFWLSIENLRIKATGVKGFVGNDKDVAAVSINSSDLEIKAQTEAISNFRDVTLNGGCTFMPLTYQFDKEKWGITTESGAIANEVNIQRQTSFNFRIGGHNIGSVNYKILNTIPGVTVGANGEFSYNPERSVLTMRDVTIDNGKREGSAIFISKPDNGKPNLTMELFGTNKITSIGGIEFYSEQNLMTGTGSLTIEAEKHAIHLKDVLTVENITLDLRSKTQYAISKEFSDAKKIFIKDAKVFFKSDVYESPVYGVEPILTNCEIVYPEGAKWDGNLFKAADGSDLVAGDVVRIASHLTGVALTPTLTLKKGTKMQLVHQLVPRNAIEETNVSWSTSDENIVSVTPDGKIECKEIGTAKITVQTNLDNHTATCEVTVTEPAGVEEAVFEGVVVAPNPFSGMLRITLGKEGDSFSYVLMNAQGVVIRKGVMQEAETRIDTEALPAGLYILQLQGKEGAVKSWRVVK
ncbi:MAG: Ig-like domain-containing protein [Bacteroides sp.]